MFTNGEQDLPKQYVHFVIDSLIGVGGVGVTIQGNQWWKKAILNKSKFTLAGNCGQMQQIHIKNGFLIFPGLICSFHFPLIHPSIHYLYHLSVRVTGRLEPIPADFVWEAGYTLGRFTLFWFTKIQFNQ